MLPIAWNVEKYNFENRKNFHLEKFGTWIFFKKLKILEKIEFSPIHVLSLIFKCNVVSAWQASLKFHYSNTCNIEVFNNRLNFYR